MIAKKYRLSEKELRKVFREKKPFFSSIMIANVRKNSLDHTRFALLLSGKNTPGGVNRNAFRRIFYTTSRDFLKNSYDVVIVLKKGTRLSYKNPHDINRFRENLYILYQKIFPL